MRPSAESLVGQVVVVTGGGRGIGRVIAERLAWLGATVAIVGRSEESLADAAQAIAAAGLACNAYTADVTEPEGVARVFASLEAELGEIDLLINNAGRYAVVGPLWETDPDAWWSDVEGNLRTAFLCARFALPGMISRRRGRIVTLASGAGTEPRPYGSAYGVAKAATILLTEAIAISAERFNVQAFALHPGPVKTDMSDWLTNEEVAKWMPEYREIYRNHAVSPDLTADAVAAIAIGHLDPLSGRFIDARSNLATLVANAADIRRQDLLTLRLRGMPADSATHLIPAGGATDAPVE